MISFKISKRFYMQSQRYKFLKLKERPYEILGLIGFLLIISSLISNHASSFDISLHDTYFVIANLDVYRFFGILLLFVWSMYLFMKRFLLSNSLTWFHVISILLPLLIFTIFSLTHPSTNEIPRRYYAFREFEKMKSRYNEGTVYAILFLVFCLGQIVFPINILGGVIKKYWAPSS